MLSKEALDDLQQIAKNAVFEPFEGKKQLELMKKTRISLEGKITSLMEKKKELFQSIKKADSQLVKNFQEILHEFTSKANQLKEHSHKYYEKLQEKIKKIALQYLKKVLEHLCHEDIEKWMLQRVPKVLKSKKGLSFDQLKNLTREEKEQLLLALYPYDSPTLQAYKKSFDVSINLTLGALVATNLPGTGPLVGFINMIKTIVKVANRITLVSLIFGRQIVNLEALFQVSGSIIQSIENWENNPNHTPLSIHIIDQLYFQKDQTGKELTDLLEHSFKKDAYITIPGVGMLSLGKILLDDWKIDQLVLAIMKNYFFYHEWSTSLGKLQTDQTIQDFQLIYKEFQKQNYYDLVKNYLKTLDQKSTSSIKQKWENFWKGLQGEDMISEISSKQLDKWVREIFTSCKQTNINQEIFIVQKVESFMKIMY